MATHNIRITSPSGGLPQRPPNAMPKCRHPCEIATHLQEEIMSRMALLTLVAALALPISLAGQDPEPDPVAVEVAVAALRGLQADGVLPGEPEQLRTILVEREDASSPQRAFDLEVLAAVGMTADAEGVSHPECE